MQREQQDLCESIARPLEHLKHVLCRASDSKNFELIFCLISTVADNISPDKGKRARVHATIHEAPDVKQMSKASTVSDSLSQILMFIKRFENMRASSHINSHSLAALTDTRSKNENYPFVYTHISSSPARTRRTLVDSPPHSCLFFTRLFTFKSSSAACERGTATFLALIQKNTAFRCYENSKAFRQRARLTRINLVSD